MIILYKCAVFIETHTHIHHLHTEIVLLTHRNIIVSEHRTLLSTLPATFIDKIALLLNCYVIFLSNEGVTTLVLKQLNLKFR